MALVWGALAEGRAKEEEESSPRRCLRIAIRSLERRWCGVVTDLGRNASSFLSTLIRICTNGRIMKEFLISSEHGTGLKWHMIYSRSGLITREF